MTRVRTSCSWVGGGLALQCGSSQIRDGATWEDAGTHSLSPPVFLSHPMSQGGRRLWTQDTAQGRQQNTTTSPQWPRSLDDTSA